MSLHPMAAAVAALVAATPALAQQVTKGAPAEPAAAVEIKGSSQAQRQNDTASRIVVTREEILKFGDQSTLDVLKRLPGVTVADGAVRMRGLGRGYTQVLLNGERAPAGFSLENLPPDQIERIEVIRAATAEYSTQSIAGTINVVLRRTTTKKSRELKVGVARRAPNVISPGFNLALSDKLDRYAYTLNANVGYYNGHTSGSLSHEARGADGEVLERRQTNSFNRHVSTNASLNAKVDWKTDRGDTLAWQGFLNGVRYHGNTRNPTATLAGPAYPYPEMDYRFKGDTGTIRTDINWVAKLGDGNKLETKAGVYTSGSGRDMTAQGRNAANTTVFDRFNTGEERDKGATWTGKYSTALLEDHAMAIGWDASRSLRSQHDTQDDQVLVAGAEPFDFDNRFGASVNNLALYARDEWDVAKGWSVYLGARWETVRTRANDGERDVDSRTSVLSPIAQTLWKIPGTKGDQLRLAVTRTYKAPQLFEIVARRYYNAFNTAVTPDYAGNPNLKPELAFGVDAGYEHYWADGAMVAVSATSREIRDVIGSQLALEGERWVNRPGNRGKAHVRSLEVETKFPLAALAAGAPPVNLRASVARNWSELDEVPGPDNRLAAQPLWTATAGADYKWQQWSLGANFSFTSGGWTRASVAESNYTVARRDLEAYALYSIDARNKLRITALNLFGSGKDVVSRFETPGRVTENRDLQPGYAGWRVLYEAAF